MKKWAIIDSKENVVVNMIIWDGASEWKQPLNTEVVEINDVVPGIGWKYVNQCFEPPSPIEYPQPPED